MRALSISFHGHAGALFSVNELDMEVGEVTPRIILRRRHQMPQTPMALAEVVARVIAHDDSLRRSRDYQLRPFVHHHTAVAIYDLDTFALEQELHRIFIILCLICHRLAYRDQTHVAHTLLFVEHTSRLADADAELR